MSESRHYFRKNPGSSHYCVSTTGGNVRKKTLLYKEPWIVSLLCVNYRGKCQKEDITLERTLDRLITVCQLQGEMSERRHYFRKNPGSSHYCVSTTGGNVRKKTLL